MFLSAQALQRGRIQAICGQRGGGVGHYARAVIGAASRRSYYAAAAELPEHELFEHLVSIGRAQRAASQRLSAVRVGSAETSLP